MKSLLLSLILLIPLFLNAQDVAQDVIIMKNGDEVKTKVVEVGIDNIKHQKQSEGPLYVLRKSEVFMIKYADGTKELYGNNLTTEVKVDSSQIEFTGPDKNSQIAFQGQKDGGLFYKGKKSGAGGTLATTLVVGIFGLIPAIACSSTPPSISNLNIPEGIYSKNPIYIDAYRTEAKKIKSRKVWSFFGFGVGVNILVLLALSSN